MLNGRAPVQLVTSGKSAGIDLAYQRANAGELIDTYPVGSANGTARHFMPNMMPAFAVRDGVISYAAKQSCGHAIIVDHQNGWASYYANLEFMFAAPTGERSRRASARVKAGDVLGYIGAPQPGNFKCLHFQLWKRDDGGGHFEPVDTSQEMAMWSFVPWTDPRLTQEVA
ncbi:MAG: M23 family metallopeptidase [Kofleriaceae bacterium]